MGRFAMGILVAAVLCGPAMAQQARPDDGWWKDEAWWRDGRLAAPKTHPVKSERLEVRGNDVEIPVLVLRPADDARHPAVLFVHGRRGLDEVVELHARRLAARGFVVFAPDLYSGRFIEKFPIGHDYALEKDVGVALDALLRRADIGSKRACLYSHTRGGYYALKLAVTQKRQEKDVACYVSYYPHLQDPNAPEPMQVYRYAPEVDALTIPALVFMGEHEQYQRKRGIEMAMESLRGKGRPARLVVYPGVGRGFEFRADPVRTFADDLASKDAILRAADFMRAHLR